MSRWRFKDKEKEEMVPFNINSSFQFPKNKEYVLFNCIFSSKNSDDYFHQNIYIAFYVAKIM